MVSSERKAKSKARSRRLASRANIAIVNARRAQIRISSADSSTPTVVEGSNTERMNEESKIKQNIEEIKNSEPAKIIEQINRQEKSTEQNLGGELI